MNRRSFFEFFGLAPAIPLVRQIERMDLQPDDVIVITVQGHATQEKLENIKTMIESKFPGHCIIVHDSSIEIKVIRDLQKDPRLKDPRLTATPLFTTRHRDDKGHI